MATPKYDYQTWSAPLGGSEPVQRGGVDASQHPRVDAVIAALADQKWEPHLLSTHEGNVVVIFRRERR